MCLPGCWTLSCTPSPTHTHSSYQSAQNMTKKLTIKWRRCDPNLRLSTEDSQVNYESPPPPWLTVTPISHDTVFPRVWVPLLPQHVLLKVWVSLEVPITLPTTVCCRTDMINQLLTEFWGVELSSLVLFLRGLKCEAVRRGAALARFAMGSFDPTHQTVSMRAGRIERSKKQVPQGTVEILQT